MKHCVLASRAKARTAMIVAPLLLLSACCADDDDPIVFEPSGNSLIAYGVVDARALEAFAEALVDNPDVDTLVLQWVPGSADDDANLMLARTVNSLRLTTIVPGDGLVSSGGTDLFLAGTDRIIEPGACIGVHSWGDDIVGAGSDAPRDAPVHRLYLRYYADIGIDPAFYWYTLDAAGPDDMHWMTPQEQLRFDLATEPPQLAAAQAADSCEARTELP